IARSLNAEDLRTKNGGPWSRRRVQDMLLNPVYAGRVARRGRGSGRDYVRLAEPEVVEASNVEALIEPARWDAIVAARATRDAVAPDSRKRGGRPTTRHALSGSAACERCGSRMYARTSPYVRRDGTRARTYVCASVHGGTGACDQPTIDAERIDTSVVAYLDRLFV